MTVPPLARGRRGRGQARQRREVRCDFPRRNGMGRAAYLVSKPTSHVAANLSPLARWIAAWQAIGVVGECLRRTTVAARLPLRSRVVLPSARKKGARHSCYLFAVEVGTVVGGGGSSAAREGAKRSGAGAPRRAGSLRLSARPGHGFWLRGSWRDPRVMSLRTSRRWRAANVIGQAFDAVGAGGFVFPLAPPSPSSGARDRAPDPSPALPNAVSVEPSHHRERGSFPDPWPPWLTGATWSCLITAALLFP